MNEHSPKPVRPVKVALLGCGVVGSQVARLLHEQAGDLAARDTAAEEGHLDGANWFRGVLVHRGPSSHRLRGLVTPMPIAGGSVDQTV